MTYDAIKLIIHALPVWYTEVRYRGNIWWLTKEIFNEGKSIKIYASELWGEDVISMNRYETPKQNYIKPCEMPKHKVVDFLLGLQIPTMKNIPIDAKNTLICWLWCFRWVQAAFDKQMWVIETEVWYAWGSQIEHPNYENISDYTESIKVIFDPEVTSYKTLVDFIFEYKDLTFKSSKNQYKYAIRHLDNKQKNIVDEKIQQTQVSYTQRPIALQNLEHTHFERAEEYHQKYFEKHNVKGDIC